jgi:hypothetical protein
MIIRFELLNPERSLFGFDYQLERISEAKDANGVPTLKFNEDGHPILAEYNVFSIGLVFFTILIRTRRGT